MSRQALMHEDGVNANILKDDKLEKDNNPKFTNEEVRKYTRINLFSLALKLRLSITKYDGDNKYRLFLVSLTVTTSILVLTYLNAILQNIFWNTSKMQTFIKWLKIISTISGFRYYRNASTCLGNDLLPFLCLFILLAYDVYVIRIIASLQKDIRVKIESLENVDDEFKRESGKTQINELTEKDILRLDEKADQKDKDSDVDSDEKEDDFKDIFTLELGADEKELILDKIDFNTLINPEDLSNNKDIELALLDDQDRQEIKIRASEEGQRRKPQEVHLLRHPRVPGFAQMELLRVLPDLHEQRREELQETYAGYAQVQEQEGALLLRLRKTKATMRAARSSSAKKMISRTRIS